MEMKFTDPYFLIGLVAIVVGVLVYLLDMLVFLQISMFGLPLTTLALVVIGVLMIYFKGMKK